MVVYRFDMAGYGPARWIVFAAMAVVLLYPIDRILMWIGLSSFWAILMPVPFFNLIGFWVLTSVE